MSDDLPKARDDDASEEDASPTLRERLFGSLGGVSDALGPVGEALTSRIMKATYVAAILVSSAGGLVYFSAQTAGIISTIVYVMAFLAGATAIPLLILLGAPSFPGFLRSIMGKLHWVLGQVAFGVGYLVQRGNRWEMWPGNRDRVWIDGEWRDIDGGQENLHILGWKPFGIIFDKEADDMDEQRVDIDGTATDGGQLTREGHRQAAPDTKAIESSNTWVVDLKHLFESGLRDIGSVRMIEKAEEVIKREETAEGSLGGWETIVATAIGVILGIICGYAVMGGF
jgi:hypothetical protein